MYGRVGKPQPLRDARNDDARDDGERLAHPAGVLNDLSHENPTHRIGGQRHPRRGVLPQPARPSNVWLGRFIFWKMFLERFHGKKLGIIF